LKAGKSLIVTENIPMDSVVLFFFFFLTIVLLIAAINDLRFHKIPNWLIYPTILFAVAYHTCTKGVEGFLFSLGGIGLGIAVLIIPYLTGGVGAGDTKLMGAIGGLLGPKGVFLAFLFSTVMGGIHAILFLALNGHLKDLRKSNKRILGCFPFELKGGHIVLTYGDRKPKLCYGLSIALGTFFSVVWGLTI
jgi:prepilin peptidase CpaA